MSEPTLMHEIGSGVTAAFAALCVAVIMHVGSNAIGIPLPAFLNGWLSALVFTGTYRLVCKEAK